MARIRFDPVPVAGLSSASPSPSPSPASSAEQDEALHFAIDRSTGAHWHRVGHRVLYADTDAAGVVYHANYLRYFEQGRGALMRELGHPYKAIETSGFIYPVVDVRVSYYRGLAYDDVMWIYTRPTRLEHVRLTFDYRIVHADSDVLVSVGSTCHACIDATRRPVPIDQRSVALCARFGVERHVWGTGSATATAT